VTTALSAYLAGLPFTPDPFQIEAVAHIERGSSVVVTAPTGAGKTVVAEAALRHALAAGRRAFYTTPIKALSNQKFGDLRREHGEERVGLLTGDNVVNGDAPIVVMTTEVLRNMIYSDVSRLDSLGIVVLDEVHYLQDPYRGSVWEEVIIHLPRHVQLVNLSATIANGEEFTDWVRSRRGVTELVVESQRPVPLESLWMVQDRHRENALVTLPVFAADGRSPNPAVTKLLRKGRGRHRRFGSPRRLEVVSELASIGRLPAIYFIFSRAGCDQAAQIVAAANLGLTDRSEREAIRAEVDARTAHLSSDDLAVLGFDSFVATLEAGVAAHHAGMVPAFKETVEGLFAVGLVKLVFATETLALGINMPARSVVIERLSKFNGEAHVLLQPGDYTQLSGRAGRRGIDDAGTSVILHQRDVPFDRIAAIAAQGSHPLASSFAPSYNMAVNLVANYTRERAEDLLAASFAQHRIESRRKELEERATERETEAAEFRGLAQCELGDIATFDPTSQADLRQTMRDFAQQSLAGDVFELPGDDGPERWALLARGYGPNPRLHLVDTGGEERKIGASDLPATAAIVGTVELPEPFRPRDRSYRSSVARAVAEMTATSRRIAGGDTTHPVAGCPHVADHLRWLQRAVKAEKDARRLRRRVVQRSDDLVARFRTLLDLLAARDYVDDWTLTPKGETLRFIYNELDVVVAETGWSGAMEGLTAAELAGVVSAFVYEPRRDDVGGGIPTLAVGHALDAIAAISDEIAVEEDRRGIDMSRAPDDGYVSRLHDWASGASLEDLFDDDEARAGDFVRIARQTLDLLRQVRDAFPELRETAATAIDIVDRGVVAAEGRW
jgi:ATP-dependent RNA helicase HelY